MVFILADNWGFGDLGCFGNPDIRTPCLDRFAEQGGRYTRFYTASCVCSPSQCSFITGHYTGRWQVHAHFARYDLNEQRHMPNGGHRCRASCSRTAIAPPTTASGISAGAAESMGIPTRHL